MYRQCLLKRTTENGEAFDVAFIPIKFAKIGKFLLIGPEKKQWQVLELYSTKTIEELDTQRNAHKRWEEVLS